MLSRIANRLPRRLLTKQGFLSQLPLSQKMSFHFATKEYAACFQNLPQANAAVLRTSTLEYLKSFDPKSWYDDPIVSLLKGEKLAGGTTVDTKNALGVVNGSQILAHAEDCRLLKEHIKTYTPKQIDLREKMRRIENKLLTQHAGFLIGNQCLDFMKQDGITEIEEAIMANVVEQKLNDLLLKDEADGVLTVNRQPIYVSCVSNFTNFLDLCRKTIRSLEVGIPCVVLGRSNTAQHPYRWTRLLIDLMQEEKIDPGMVTFLSCSLNDIKDITSSCKDSTGNLYTTCSRELAADIMSTYPKTVASTGGPNTLVATELTDAVKQAIQMSASIECSGQCTALRHCVVPPDTDDAVLNGVFDSIKNVSSAPEALEKAMFDAIFEKHAGTSSPDPSTTPYKAHNTVDAYIKIDEKLPQPGINEYWRKVVVDFSKLDVEQEAHLNQLAKWLNVNQPISLAVNGKRNMAIKLLLKLWEKTGMVVNTVGSSDTPEMPPALTCQARPQEGEIFGEFPPRGELEKYTKFPVVVPSSNPSYDAEYSHDYLQGLKVSENTGSTTRALLEEVKNPTVLGYCVVLIDYLKNVTEFNPKHGGRARTALWGIQRPPLGSTTIISCSATASWDDIAPLFLIFYVSNARSQVELSIDPMNKQMIALCEKHKIPHTVENKDKLNARSASLDNLFNLVHVDGPIQKFPMAGNFVSLYFPLGHIKSTMPNDQEFVFKARVSEKWLNTLF